MAVDTDATGLPEGSAEDKLRIVKEWVCDHDDISIVGNELSRRDRQFYDGQQWTDEEIHELEKRGQPAVVLNRIFPRINDIIGFERENRTDFRAHPRTYNQHQRDADAVTDAIKYWEDEQGFDDVALMVLENLAVEGLGGVVLDLGVERDPLSDGKRDRNRVDLTYLPWDRIWYDAHSRLPDFSDALYTGILTWMHLSEALKRWPEKEAQLRNVVNTQQRSLYGQEKEDHPNLWYWTDMQRVAVRTVYYWELDEDGHKVWYEGKFVESGWLEEPEVVHWRDDNDLTFNPMILTSGFVQYGTNARYGAVRAMISPQEEINKRRSKALHHFTADRFLAEESAIDNAQRIKQEMAKPDAIVVLNDGALNEGRFQPAPTTDKGQLHLQLAQEAKAEIEEIGPSGLQSVQGPEDVSGRSFLLQQNSGMRKIGPLFAHYRSWKLKVVRHAWYGIRQYWPEERWIRVRDKSDIRSYKFVKLNQKMTRRDRVVELMDRGASLEEAVQEAMGDVGMQLLQKVETNSAVAIQQLQQMGVQPDEKLIAHRMEEELLSNPLADEEFTMNDVSKAVVDLVFDVQPNNTLLEHEEFGLLIELARNGQLPGVPPAEIIKRARFLHNREELVAAMQAPPPPEVQQQEQMQIQLQMAQLQAQVAKMEAEAAQAQAKSQTLLADVQKKLAEAQIMIPAEAQRDIAHSKKLRAESAEMLTNATLAPDKLELEAEANDIKALHASNQALGAAPNLRQKTQGK